MKKSFWCKIGFHCWHTIEGTETKYYSEKKQVSCCLDPDPYVLRRISKKFAGLIVLSYTYKRRCCLCGKIETKLGYAHESKWNSFVEPDNQLKTNR